MTEKINRLGASVLEYPLSEDQRQRAVEAVRVFSRSDGMLAVQRELEEYRQECTKVLYKQASNVPAVAYAEASGAVRSIDKFLEIFDSILREADKVREFD